MRNPNACNITGCMDETDAPWSPVLMLRVAAGAIPALCQLGIRLCDAHKASSTVESFVSDSGWLQISGGFARAGRAVPDRALTELSWVEHEGSVLQQFRRQQGRN